MRTPTSGQIKFIFWSRQFACATRVVVFGSNKKNYPSIWSILFKLSFCNFVTRDSEEDDRLLILILVASFIIISMIVIIGGTACILLCFEESIEEKENKILAQLSKVMQKTLLTQTNTILLLLRLRRPGG